MEERWNGYGPPVCAGLGGGLALAAVWVCMNLEQGTPWDRACVAAAVAVLTAASVCLLRLEGVREDSLLVMLLPIGAAMLVRVLCLGHVTLDYEDFLHHWYVYFQENGGFQGIAGSVGDYNMPYLYFMAAISYLSVPDLYLIKLFSILWDVLLAWGCLRLVRSLTRERQGSAAPLIAFGAALLLPTVVLNGAYWAQCDVIYGALAIHAAALALEGQNKTSVALMGIAFSFKLQSIFVLPLWGVLWLAGRVKFRELWMFPLAYLATILPAMVLGKPLGDILGIYVTQLGEYPRLTLNAPSVYQFIPYGVQVDGALAGKLGIAAAGALVLALLALGFWLGDRLNRETIMAIAVVLCVGVPFFLPHMHERYFFLADVFTLCWACANWRRLPAAVLAGGASLASYCVYLRLKYNCVLNLGGMRFVMGLEALVVLAALVFSLWALTGEIRRTKERAV